jgi:hypothetical protein
VNTGTSSLCVTEIWEGRGEKEENYEKR